jgi:hypothetical protein
LNAVLAFTYFSGDRGSGITCACVGWLAFTSLIDFAITIIVKVVANLGLWLARLTRLSLTVHARSHGDFADAHAAGCVKEPLIDFAVAIIIEVVAGLGGGANDSGTRAPASFHTCAGSWVTRTFRVSGAWLGDSVGALAARLPFSAAWVWQVRCHVGFVGSEIVLRRDISNVLSGRNAAV